MSSMGLVSFKGAKGGGGFTGHMDHGLGCCRRRGGAGRVEGGEGAGGGGTDHPTPLAPLSTFQLPLPGGKRVLRGQ